MALAGIGPSALPEFTAILADTNAPYGARAEASHHGAYVIRYPHNYDYLGTDAERFIRALIRNLNDPDPRLVAATASALSLLNANPKLIFPTLASAVTNENPTVRRIANDGFRLLQHPSVKGLVEPGVNIRAKNTNTSQFILFKD